MFCPQCGQPVQPSSAALQHCLACGTQFSVHSRSGPGGLPRPSDAQSPSASGLPGRRVPRSSPLPSDAPPPAPPRGAAVAVVVAAATVLLAAVGVAVALWSRGGGAGAAGPLPGPRGSSAGAAQQANDPVGQSDLAGHLARAERQLRRVGAGAADALRWSMTAPAVIDWTGDGTEDVVGAVKLSPRQWAIAGFDGQDLRLLWQSPPFAAENAQLRLQVAGKKVLVLNQQSHQLRVIEPASGETVAELALSDKPTRACADPGDAERAWIEVDDHNHQLLDLAKGTMAAAERPAWCPQRARSAGNIHCGMSQNPMVADCQGSAAAPKVAGTHARLMLVEGNLGVVQAEKSPGTAYARLYGVTLDDQRVRWQATPSANGDSQPSATRLADLIGGFYVEVVPLQSGDVELVAFRAATGERLWAKPIATKDSYTDSFAAHAFLMTPKRVYAAVGTFASKLRVFEVATGREVGSIGQL